MSKKQLRIWTIATLAVGLLVATYVVSLAAIAYGTLRGWVPGQVYQAYRFPLSLVENMPVGDVIAEYIETWAWRGLCDRLEELGGVPDRVNCP